MNQTELENRFHDCIFLKLHSVTVQLEESPSTERLLYSHRDSSNVNESVGIELTIRFGEHQISVPRGQVRFGLKRGELKLKIENGRMPLEMMEMTGEFKPDIEFEEQQEGGRETESSTTIGGPTLGSFIGRIKGTSKKSTKQKYIVNQVYTRGTEEKPIWVFEAKTNEPILKGQITRKRLGVVQILDRPCRITATFEIRGQRDLYLVEAEGFLKAKNLSRNKTALLMREWFLRFITPQLQPCLSHTEVEL
jgi:hypothetical protein